MGRLRAQSLKVFKNCREQQLSYEENLKTKLPKNFQPPLPHKGSDLYLSGQGTHNAKERERESKEK